MKVAAAKHNPEVLEAYREAFSQIPCSVKVETRPETGSIVILYDPKAHDDVHGHLCNHELCHHEGEEERPGDEIDKIARRIENEAEFLAQRSEFAKFTVDAFKGFDRELKLLTDNTIDLKIVLAGGLAAITFLEIGAEAATPMWVTLALFSLNHFVELHNAQHPAPAAGTSARG
jgi:hypothetical protein